MWRAADITCEGAEENAVRWARTFACALNRVPQPLWWVSTPGDLFRNLEAGLGIWTRILCDQPPHDGYDDALRMLRALSPEDWHEMQRQWRILGEGHVFGVAGLSVPWGGQERGGYRVAGR